MRRILALAGALALALGTLFMAAIPASADPTVQIFLLADHGACVHANGQGNQVTMDNCSIGANFDEHNIAGTTRFTFTDGNGNCLRMKNDLTVEIGNGACNPSDTGAQWWINTGNRMQNVAHSGDYAYSPCDCFGRGVVGRPYPGPSGYYALSPANF